MSRQQYKIAGKKGLIMMSVILLMVVLAASSCKKFLSTYSQNKVFIQTAADLDELLLGDGYMSVFNQENPPFWVDLLDDDVEENPSSIVSGANLIFESAGIHHWQQLPFTKSDGSAWEDGYYTAMYKKISVLNTILYNIPGIQQKGEPADTLQRISGEAHFLRAYYYFILSNFYGRPYSVSTAANDLSVPLKTDPAVEDKRFARSSVKQVYEQIVKDLLDSERELATHNQQSAIRANQASAQALLSRVYLYMEDYENAITYANKVIGKNPYRVVNQNNFASGTAFLKKASTETIFALPDRGQLGLSYRMFSSGDVSRIDNFRVSPDLKNSYTANDLRLQVFFLHSPSGELLTRKGGTTPDLIEEMLIRLPELYLIKAEALAVLGRTGEAVNALQELRKNRFKPEHLTAITETGAALVNYIRDERRRELCFEWQRWFDLKRYGVNAKFPFGKAIRHISYAYDNAGRYIQGYYELKAYEQDKPAYVIPIPRVEIEFNAGALSNEPRPDRPLIR